MDPSQNPTEPTPTDNRGRHTHPATRGRACLVCSLPFATLTKLEERLKTDKSVTATHRWAVKTFPTEMVRVSYDVLARHKRQHLDGTWRAARKLSDAERMLRKQHQLAKDVLADKIDPQAYFGPAALAQDISRVEKRLDSAADSAFDDGEHASLASLSGQLLRSAELRAKIGGSVADNPAVSVVIQTSELHARLDTILGAPDVERRGAAMSLLGLSSSSLPMPLAAHADPPHARTREDNSSFDPVTIDADPFADTLSSTLVTAEPLELAPVELAPGEPTAAPLHPPRSFEEIGPSPNATVRRHWQDR